MSGDDDEGSELAHFKTKRKVEYNFPLMKSLEVMLCSLQSTVEG